MASEMCRNFGPAKNLFDNASAILGFDLQKVCANGPPDTLNATVVVIMKVSTASHAYISEHAGYRPGGHICRLNGRA